MNVFEIRNLQNSEDRKEKRKTFLRSLIKSVDTGANGTLDYIVKKGSGKNKIAKTRPVSYTHLTLPTIYSV